MKVKYIGCWTSNNCSTYQDGLEFASKRKAIKTLRKICKANVFAGSTGHVMLYNAPYESGDRPIYAATIKN